MTAREWPPKSTTTTVCCSHSGLIEPQNETRVDGGIPAADPWFSSETAVATCTQEQGNSAAFQIGVLVSCPPAGTACSQHKSLSSALVQVGIRRSRDTL